MNYITVVQVLVFALVGVTQSRVSHVAYSSRTSTKPVPMSCTDSCEELLRKKNTPDVICSCNSGCVVYGDCCRNATFRNDDSVRREFGCVILSGLGPVSVVNSCPESSSDIISESCEAATKLYGPVTSQDTGISYANIYCAFCNDDSDNLVDWPVTLSCCKHRRWTSRMAEREYFQYDYDSELMFMVSELKNGSRVSCDCTFEAKNGDLAFARFLELRDCTLDYVSSCSHTWKSGAIRNSCKAYLDPVYVGDVVYGNRYCAMCNYEKGSGLSCPGSDFNPVLASWRRLSAFCKARRIKDCQAYVREQGHVISMTQLFAMYEEKCVPPKGRLCCGGQRYDKFRQECRDPPKRPEV